MGCALFPLQKIVFRSNQGAMDMEKYVHRENVALFKKRLAEAHSSEARVNAREALMTDCFARHDGGDSGD